jgi:hypothetical protein
MCLSLLCLVCVRPEARGVKRNIIIDSLREESGKLSHLTYSTTKVEFVESSPLSRRFHFEFAPMTDANALTYNGEMTSPPPSKLL